MNRDEVRSVIEGRGAAPRVPVLLHFWTHAAEFGDRKPAVEAIMDRYPQDVQLIGVRLPGIGETPAEDPGYRWLRGGPREAGRALDAQALIADWGELDDIVARFPDPRSPVALPENPTSDGRYRLAGWWYCLFERHWSLRGMTNPLTGCYTDPGSVHRLYRALIDFYAGLIDRIGTELGADGVFTSDDIGMHFWLHACGAIEPFIPKLIDLGPDVIHPIQKCAMDEREIARKYDGRICVWAGFDVQRIIPFGTPDEVRAEVRHLMDTWHRPEGRLLFSAGNGINGDCPLASLEALYDEAYAYGSITASRSRPAAPGRP